MKATPGSLAGSDSQDGTVPLPRPLKQKIKDALVALSLANLCFIKVSFDLLSEQHRFYDKLLVTPATLLALLINISSLSLLLWLAIQALRRFPNRWFRLGAHLCFFLLLLFPLDFIRMQYLIITDYDIFRFFTQPVVAASSLVLLALLVWQHQRVAHILAIVTGIFSPLALLVLAKILLTSCGLLQLKQCTELPAPPRQLQPRRVGQPRVLWIIFDCMDYRLAFEQRPAGVELAEFDRLKAQSLFSVNAYSPNCSTIPSMPALIYGRRIAAALSDDTCDLTVTWADTGLTTTCTGLPSVFSEARELGFNTAVVGWAVPYSRMFGQDLNFCEWYPYPPFQPSRAVTLGANLRQQLFSLGEAFWLRHLFVEVHLESLQMSLAVVTNASFGLTLLHLPAPHRPGVYLPNQDRLTFLPLMSKVGGYLNNLILADRELGKLRVALEQAGLAHDTWMIVSADHSWSESTLYDGRRDTRVPFIVRAPGADAPIVYAHDFNTVLTHDLILALLRNQVTNQENVAEWLDLHRSAKNDNRPPTGEEE
ncbi:MAG TPA: sulfatase-like hydrolase/transferase [Candidatus Acidoferrum sp.]|nr:sulfatase-like hydrolase/transferase [Candidatus Acidoferrum sp.]